MYNLYILIVVQIMMIQISPPNIKMLSTRLMVGCRVDVVEVDLGDGHGNYSMTMYVANITDNCILGLDYLKARKAVINLSQGVLVVNDTIVKEKYKYAEATPVRTHKVRLVDDCHLFPNSVSRATVGI